MNKNSSLCLKLFKFLNSVFFSWDIQNNIIQIWSDEGRLIRPLLKIKDRNLIYNKDIIISSYESGENYDDLTIYQKNKVANYSAIRLEKNFHVIHQYY